MSQLKNRLAENSSKLGKNTNQQIGSDVHQQQTNANLNLIGTNNVGNPAIGAGENIHKEAQRNSGLQYNGEIRKQSSTQDRSSKFNDIIPRNSSQGLTGISKNAQNLVFQKTTISQQFSMTTDNPVQGYQFAKQEMPNLTENSTQKELFFDRQENPSVHENVVDSYDGHMVPGSKNSTTGMPNATATCQVMDYTQNNSSAGQTMDATGMGTGLGTSGGSVKAASGCQWWQNNNNNYIAFKNRNKNDLDDKSAGTLGQLAAHKNQHQSLKEPSKQQSGSQLFKNEQISESVDGYGRGTLSLLSNKPLRVGNHHCNNLLYDQNKQQNQQVVQQHAGNNHKLGGLQQQASSGCLIGTQAKSLPSRMIVNQQVSTVQSTMGLYGLSNPASTHIQVGGHHDKFPLNSKLNDSKISTTHPTNASSDDGKHLISSAQQPLFKLYLQKTNQNHLAAATDLVYQNNNLNQKSFKEYQDNNHIHQGDLGLDSSSQNNAANSEPPLTLSSRHKLKLSSARHARPPKGVISSTSNKAIVDSQGRNPNWPDQVGPSSAAHHSATHGLTSSEKRPPGGTGTGITTAGLTSYASIKSGLAVADSCDRNPMVDMGNGPLVPVSTESEKPSTKQGRDAQKHQSKQRQPMALRRRLKSTQHSVDINKIRAQQEFMEHKARLIQQNNQKDSQMLTKQPSTNDFSTKQSISMSKKKRAGSRPQSSIPPSSSINPNNQMSKRKSRMDRNGKRTALVSQHNKNIDTNGIKNMSTRKCTELLDELEKVAQDTESLKQTLEQRSKDYEQVQDNTAGKAQRKSNSVLKAVHNSSKMNENQEKEEQSPAKIILALPLPLPPRIESTRKEKQSLLESERLKQSHLLKPLRNSVSNVDSKMKMAMLTSGKRQSQCESNMESPVRRDVKMDTDEDDQINQIIMSTESVPIQFDKTRNDNLISIDAHKQSIQLLPANESQSPSQRNSNIKASKPMQTLEHSKSSPALVKSKDENANLSQIAPQMDVQLPQISAQAFLIYDFTTNQLLLSRKCSQKREVASITKMMTFYTVLKLIERYHDILHLYSFDLASLTQEQPAAGSLDTPGQTLSSFQITQKKQQSASQAQKTQQKPIHLPQNGPSTSQTHQSTLLKPHHQSSHRTSQPKNPLTDTSGHPPPAETSGPSKPQSSPSSSQFGHLDACLQLYARISRKASKVPGTTAHLRDGDVLTIDQLLYGMMLPSGNDSAYALAEFFGKVLKENKYCVTNSNGGVPEENEDLTKTNSIAFNNSFVMKSHSSPYIRCFLMEMNFHGQKLGLSNTVYDSPHGLINKNNVSCAQDVAKLIRECMIGGKSSGFRSKKVQAHGVSSGPLAAPYNTAVSKTAVDKSSENNSQSVVKSQTDIPDCSLKSKSLGWIQQVYRRVVGTKRHETHAIVPVELTAKDIKKQMKQLKKKNANIVESDDEKLDGHEDGGEEAPELADKEGKKEEQEPEVQSKENEAVTVKVSKIKLKSRRYRWENTNKLLNVEIDTWKNQVQETQCQDSQARKPAQNSETPEIQYVPKIADPPGGRIIGCKTGITQSAGPCFAGFYENLETGVQLAVIVLHSQTSDLRWHEIKQMVRWAHLCDRSKISAANGQFHRKRPRRKITAQPYQNI